VQYVADLHLHSKYSRAVSPQMVLPVMSEWAIKKGIDILATADWTHPLWSRHLKEELEEDGEGLFKVKNSSSKFKSEKKDPLFILSTEISSIYSQGGKTRRIHNLIFAPSLGTVEKINKEFLRRSFNLASDGRPIIGLSAKDLLELVLTIDKEAILIPCHAWTPWFSLYGSMSGFDSIEECFGKYSKFIFGVETGLSSDPVMNWRIKELKNKAILSSSDSHSPAKMGREATVFELEKPTFKNIRRAILGPSLKPNWSKLPDRIDYTIEFYPEEGKYHYTGHRNCRVVQSPKETKEKGPICSVCKKGLTVGVMHRVEQLAKKEDAFVEEIDPNGVKWITDPSGNHPKYVNLVPLLEIVAESLGRPVSSVRTKEVYENICKNLGPELDILLNISIDEISIIAGEKLAEGVRKVRQRDIVIKPGFDGEYGVVKIWNSDGEQAEEPLTGKQLKSKDQLRLDF